MAEKMPTPSPEIEALRLALPGPWQPWMGNVGAGAESWWCIVDVASGHRYMLQLWLGAGCDTETPWRIRLRDSGLMWEGPTTGVALTAALAETLRRVLRGHLDAQRDLADLYASRVRELAALLEVADG